MKNSIKTFAYSLVLLATVSFTANAEDKETKKSAGFGTGIYTTKSGKINVLVDKVSNVASTTLLIKDEKGAVYYQETIGKHNQKFGRTLNVDGLPVGKYEIEVVSKGEKQSKTFELTDKKAERTLSIK
jgi:flagellar hook assembly protein FlgD